ncbi:MAG: threonine synthase [Acidobacteriota bacterium]|nr:MAG: threonine synthase [Acidobacteriota bacterium]
MQYFSTNRRSPAVSFREAVIQGQPDDKGLYFPAEIPRLKEGFVERLGEISNAEIAYEVIRPYIGNEIDEVRLHEICEETVDFDFPLVHLVDNISALELFHGPTLAFKDVGARFMSRCLGYFSQGKGEKTVVVVATSGDTGGAVAAGFHGVEGVEVVILYPKGRVSRIQELQLTTFGGNVITLEVQGSFDDCQALAKAALADEELRSRVSLTSANSINVARWLPQQFYYFFAHKQCAGEAPTVCVPSGNFGNLASGVIANLSGLPVSKFIAACNANDVVPRFLQTQKYEPIPAVATLSNAMDVGSPSNFVRILELFEHDLPQIAAKIAATSISDDETRAIIRSVYEQSNYILDPHGAVGYASLSKYLEEHGGRGYLLATAHPIKFDVVSEILGFEPEIPESVSGLAEKTKQSMEIDNDYTAVRDVILSRI